jgi:hypothetical protein
VNRLLPAALALAIALTGAPASGAPMGPGVEPARVLSFHTDAELEVAAKAMVNALRQRVLDGREFALNSFSATLIEAAHEAKCSLKGLGRPVAAAHERAFDAACLKRMSARLDAKNFFWGLLYVEGGTTLVRLHFWRDGVDRSATLPYDAAQRDQLADRLYRKLVTPNAVGDVKLTGGPAGELLVDGKPAGPYVDGTEITLETGEHLLDVRDGPRVLARGRTRIEPGGRSSATMMPVAEPPPAPATTTQAPYHDPPPITVRPKASAWPWVLGGVGGAGLAGAGVFWGLRQGERSDLHRACDGAVCPKVQRNAIERGDRYTTLTAVSLGIGVAAGAGLAVYLLTPRRPPRVSGAVVPLAGGAAAVFGGSF